MWRRHSNHELNDLTFKNWQDQTNIKYWKSNYKHRSQISNPIHPPKAPRCDICLRKHCLFCNVAHLTFRHNLSHVCMYWHMRCQTIQTGKASVAHLGFKVENFHGVKKVLVGIKRAIIVSMGKSLFPTIHLLFRFDLLKGIAQKQRSSRMERVKKCKTNLARVRRWTRVGLSEQKLISYVCK